MLHHPLTHTNQDLPGSLRPLPIFLMLLCTKFHLNHSPHHQSLWNVFPIMENSHKIIVSLSAIKQKHLYQGVVKDSLYLSSLFPVLDCTHTIRTVIPKPIILSLCMNTSCLPCLESLSPLFNLSYCNPFIIMSSLLSFEWLIPTNHSTYIHKNATLTH